MAAQLLEIADRLMPSSRSRSAGPARRGTAERPEGQRRPTQRALFG